MSLSLIKCDYCKNLHEEVKNRYCCDAFPDGIPLDKMKLLSEKDEECNNGISFEEE